MLGIFKRNYIAFKQELASFDLRERGFIFFAMLCGFFICAEYSIIRPVGNSLFIHAFSVTKLPYAWLCIIPLNFFLVSLYNKLLPRWGSKKLFSALVCLVIGINCLFAAFAKSLPALSFFFYMWKELYVLLMFQLVWSVIHTNVSLSKAKYLYGCFFGVGGLGSVFGTAFPSFFAVSFGSEALVYLSLPLYFLLGVSYWKLSQFSKGEEPKSSPDEKGGFFHGVSLIRQSKLLLFALFIVVGMQMISALVDFQFNHFLEKSFEQKDLRTQFSARVLGIVHSLNTILQFIGVYLLIRFVGYKRAHYALPSLLGLSAALILLAPVFPLVSLGFVICKALDFSLFGVLKEMLYIPLKPDEKYRAKAVIDVFAYRSAKGLASLLIISLTPFVPASSLSILTLVLAGVWIFCIGIGLKEYEKLTTN